MDYDKNRLKWIDGVRGFAMLMVILVHVAGQIPGLPYLVALFCGFGAMGVQLFFLVSAYAACLTNDIADGRKLNYAVYYIKRFMRIAPLYWFGILLYFLFAYCGIVYGGPIRDYTLGNVLLNILLMNNVFPVAQNYIVPGGWCIGCITLFYLLFPVLNVFLNSRPFLKTTCVCVSCAIVTYYLLSFTNLPKQYVYWLISNQITVFLIGMLYYKVKKLQSEGWIVWQLVLAGGIFAITALLVFNFGYGYVYQHIFVSIGFIFVLNLFRHLQYFIPIWLIRLGRLSYPIFIIHLAMSWVFIHLLGSWFRLFPRTVNLFLYTGLIAFFSVIIAQILNRLIEEPFLKLLKIIINKV